MKRYIAVLSDGQWKLCNAVEDVPIDHVRFTVAAMLDDTQSPAGIVAFYEIDQLPDWMTPEQLAHVDWGPFGEWHG